MSNTIKIVLCGDGGSGKTWISKRACNSFEKEVTSEEYFPTIVSDFYVCKFNGINP